jgi:putative nucleotidyltransferase with HDIG domain
LYCAAVSAPFAETADTDVMTITTDTNGALGALPLDPTGYAGLALDRLARQACEVLRAEQSCIMVRDPSDRRVAIAAASHGIPDEMLGSRVVLDRGPLGHAFAFGRTAAGREPDADPWTDGWDAPRVTACAPIGARPEVRGALSATSCEGRRRFSDGEVSVLRELAEVAGDALDHAGTSTTMLADIGPQLDRVVNQLSAHDRQTGLHCEAVVAIALAMGKRLGMRRACLLELELAALLHDLGKIAVPAEILSKPAPLDEGERTMVERHPVVGAELLRGLPGLEPVATIVRYHHERWDGQGYPDGLSGDRIPLASRIVSVCDSFDAMTSDRPYRAALRRDAALAELHENAGGQFDPWVVDSFHDELAASAQGTGAR